MKDGISYPMEFILNRPMFASDFEQVSCRGALGRQTRDAILHVALDLRCVFLLLVCDILINLLESWPVGVLSQEGACGEGARGNPPFCVFRVCIRLHQYTTNQIRDGRRVHLSIT